MSRLTLSDLMIKPWHRYISPPVADDRALARPAIAAAQKPV